MSDDVVTFGYVNQFEDERKIAFELRGEYDEGNDLAIEALCESFDPEQDDEPHWDYYASVTVNLPDMFHMEPNAVWVDDNNSRHLVDWMEKQNLLRFTGGLARSGFCVYREAEPSEELLKACIKYGDNSRDEPAETR